MMDGCELLPSILPGGRGDTRETQQSKQKIAPMKKVDRASDQSRQGTHDLKHDQRLISNKAASSAAVLLLQEHPTTQQQSNVPPKQARNSHLGLIEMSALATSAPTTLPVSSKAPPTSAVPTDRCKPFGNVMRTRSRSALEPLRGVTEGSTPRPVALCCGIKLSVQRGAISRARVTARRSMVVLFSQALI